MAALRYNALIAVGAVVVENERCYLRAALPLDELTAAALDRVIDFRATTGHQVGSDRAWPA